MLSSVSTYFYLKFMWFLAYLIEAPWLIIPNWLKRIFPSRLVAKDRNICEWICFLFVTIHFICLSEMYTIQIQNQIHAHNHAHKSNPKTLLAIVTHFSFLPLTTFTLYTPPKIPQYWQIDTQTKMKNKISEYFQMNCF